MNDRAVFHCSALFAHAGTSIADPAYGVASRELYKVHVAPKVREFTSVLAMLNAEKCNTPMATGGRAP